jgi:hypothetical protein
MLATPIIKYTFLTTTTLITLYAIFLTLLTSTSIQSHILYLHKIQVTWFKGLNTPELFGFLHIQVALFTIPFRKQQFAIYMAYPTPRTIRSKRSRSAHPPGRRNQRYYLTSDFPTPYKRPGSSPGYPFPRRRRDPSIRLSPAKLSCFIRWKS